MDKFVCTKCEREFGSKEALYQHTQAKHTEEVKKLRFQLNERQKRKIRNWSIFIVITVLFAGSVYFLTSSTKTLPPTDIQGHIEANPSSHILKEPMPIEIQKHMLEHADGYGPPGVVINYNCEDYNCEDGLIENLEAFAEKYTFVYIAPFPNMNAKIVLTRHGKIEILDSYDKERIENFISDISVK